VDRFADRERPIVSLERVPWSDVSAYGVADLPQGNPGRPVFPVEDFVEKPPREEAPSNLAITGRYVLTSEVFDELETTEPRVKRELQLTDAIRRLQGVLGHELRCDRFDIGNIPDCLRANVQMALRHDDGEMNEAVETLLRDHLDE
jgi:UTP--glucose-1-phosphate uridylyltransferase